MSKKGVKKASTVAGGYDEKAVEIFFNSLAESDDPEIISMEGISKLCDDLNIDPNTDVRVLVLMWKLGAGSKPGSVTRSEFQQGMKNLNKADVAGLGSILASLDPGFLDRSEFREKDMVLALLPIVLDKNRAPHLELFLQFLQSSSHQRITLDQWDSFLQFNHIIKNDLSNHEDDGAWPLLLDDYVEWRKKGGK